MAVPNPMPVAPASISGLDRAPKALPELTMLLPMWPNEIDDKTIAGREKRLLALRKSLRAERQRGLSGHWTYDLARHAALLAYYRREAAELEQLKNMA
jgi:hypothetical protein